MNKLMEILRGKRKDKKGFTLMEMLIVVAIIAVLVAIAVPTFNSSLNAAKKSADDASIKTAYTEYILFKTGTNAVSQAPEFAGGVIKFADGTEYKLQYYKSIDNYNPTADETNKVWKGNTSPASSGGGK